MNTITLLLAGALALFVLLAVLGIGVWAELEIRRIRRSRALISRVNPFIVPLDIKTGSENIRVRPHMWERR